MQYKVITTQEIDFTDAYNADIKNYRWLGGYSPDAQARLIYVKDTGIAARLECREKEPKATYKNFYDDVYKDSCLEFFFGFVRGGAYVNCEMNSLGTCLIQYGENRFNRVRIDKAFTPPKVKAGRDGDIWSVEVMFTLDEIRKLFGDVEIKRGTTFYGNFYKCGDETPIEHYGMWSPVMTVKPDFHRPEYFGEFIVE